MDFTQHNTSVLKSMSNPEREERSRSVLDLIELNTFDLDLAAWFVSVVSKGASWISGSGPSGIGKTTVMRSLLSFVPDHLRFDIALPKQVNQLGQTPSCIISNELSNHPPPTYLWDQDLRDFFAHTQNGHILVGNAHADDLDEIKTKIVDECNVPESQFQKINLFIFICLEGGNPQGRRIKDTTTRRVINKVYYSNGQTPHELVYSDRDGFLSSAPRAVETEIKYRTWLTNVFNNSERSLEGIRQQFLIASGNTTFC